ncbi:hypothetical protein F5Y16DRAFT_420157 [Xylariaceae sp. FL0255]|nr:hypothetical protein F5Y16DRAFT_420157 [Xylariaceae sp. FL0255]
MSSEQHLQIINPRQESQPSVSFSPFTRLPPELRLEIWRFSIKHPRLIRVFTTPRGDVKAPGAREPPYLVEAVGARLHVDLLQVNQEARRAALSFYRVRLPCRFFTGGGEIRGTLLINPEHDILRVYLRGGSSAFAKLLTELRAHDPSDVGIRSLALDSSAITTALDWEMRDLDSTSRAICTDTLAQLEQVFFTSIEKAGRVFLGPRGSSDILDGYEFHRSRPIMSTVASFDRVARDPRNNIAQDLSRVYGGTSDARAMLFEWQQFLEKWNIHHPPHVVSAYRFVVSTSPYYSSNPRRGRPANVSDRQSASDWLQQEEEFLFKGVKIPIESAGELERAPRPAIGFWLFPMEALGPVPSSQLSDDSQVRWESKRIIDMGRHWPELCLTHLPD